MTYVPRLFWEMRARRHGPSYVGPNGDAEATREQTPLFMLTLDEAIGGRDLGTVLDFGCGSGRFAHFLVHRADRYEGVDISRSGIEMAKEKASGDEIAFSWLVEDVLPFPDDTFDSIVIVTVAQHLPDPDWSSWSKEIRRVLRTSGCVYVIDNDKGRGRHMFSRSATILARDLGCVIEMERRASPNHWSARLKKVDVR